MSHWNLYHHLITFPACYC